MLPFVFAKGRLMLSMTLHFSSTSLMDLVYHNLTSWAG